MITDVLECNAATGEKKLVKKDIELPITPIEVKSKQTKLIEYAEAQGWI